MVSSSTTSTRTRTIVPGPAPGDNRAPVPRSAARTAVPALECLPIAAQPQIVVESRKELTYLLSQGAELEHGLMCEYLYAAFSLKGPEDGLRADQSERIERWRRVIMQIAGEEMLHWAVVQNLLAAVGSAPFVSRPHMPHQAHGYPPGVQLRLLPFGEASLRHFAYLERPEGFDFADAAGFEAAGEFLEPMGADEIIPRGQHFDTQGTLYRGVERGLATLARRLGERNLFIGPAFHQAGESAFMWPDLGPIETLAQANAALERIVEQGEGATGDWKTAHFGRFLEVLEDYLAMRREEPDFDPALPVIAAGVRAAEGVEPDAYISDPTTAGCSDLFNAVYELLLQMIARYFAFGHETPQQRAILARAAVALMFDAIKPLGLLLARLPVGPEHPGRTAGAIFQLPYRSSFLLPHRRAAWFRYAERLEELAGFAAKLEPPVGADTLATLAGRLGVIGAELMDNVEAV
ncbi:MAG TPA: ferritin-like domain-containing protein [Solirubrobacteraceae bacterium]|nr:ferritin-like domain-containing protein [Solirubrobacteraceae bacterium]